MSLPKIQDVISQIKRDEFLASYGIKCCMHCKKPWDVVEKKAIPCTTGHPLAVVCIHCFEKLSVDQIIIYINERVDWSNRALPFEDHNIVRESAAEAVRRMKQQPAA